MGRSLIRGMLNSARGISNRDVSPQAQAARRINSFAELDGLEFVARIDIGTDTNGEEKNEIRGAVTPDHKEYARLMGRHAVPAGFAPQPGYAAPAAPGPFPPTAPATPAAFPPAAPAAPQAAFLPAPGTQAAFPPPAGADPRPSWAR